MQEGRPKKKKLESSGKPWDQYDMTYTLDLGLFNNFTHKNERKIEKEPDNVCCVHIVIIANRCLASTRTYLVTIFVFLFKLALELLWLY